MGWVVVLIIVCGISAVGAVMGGHADRPVVRKSYPPPAKQIVSSERTIARLEAIKLGRPLPVVVPSIPPVVEGDTHLDFSTQNPTPPPPPPPPPPEPPKVDGQAALHDPVWRAKGETVTIGTLRIPGGMLYVGRALPTSDGYGVENCLINPELPIVEDTAPQTVQDIPYWPSYSRISPQNRLVYLTWLANGKDDPDVNIGLVFLYFYGLERRLFSDDPGPEAPDILAEVRRLLSRYGGNGSFRSYAETLLDAAAVKFGDGPGRPDPSSSRKSWELPLWLRCGIGRLLADGKAIDADWMLAWYAVHPDKGLQMPARRFPVDFSNFFFRKFAQRYPQGMKVDSPRRRLTCITYKAASGTFTAKIPLATPVPDIIDLHAPLTKIEPMIGECTEQLTAYSRFVGKHPLEIATLAAACLLPPELDDTPSAQPLRDFKAYLQTATAQGVAMIDLDAIFSKTGIALPDNGHIAKSDLTILATAFERCGFAVAPDWLSGQIAYEPGACVAVYRAPQRVEFDRSAPAYVTAKGVIDIGALVAAADGDFSERERRKIEETLAQMEALEPAARMHLQAYLTYREKTPLSFKILARFKELPPEERATLANMAVAVAMADGDPAVTEVRLMEKIYRVLDVPLSSLYSDLQAQTAEDDALTTVAVAHPDPGIAIPPQPGANVRSDGFVLDAGKLKIIRRETARVTDILTEVFADDGSAGTAELSALPDCEPPIEPETEEPDTDWNVGGLSAPYRELLYALKKQDCVSMVDFDRLACTLGLPAAGAIETINDWAFEHFDEALIDAGEPMEIAFHLLNKNQQATQ